VDCRALGDLVGGFRQRVVVEELVGNDQQVPRVVRVDPDPLGFDGADRALSVEHGLDRPRKRPRSVAARRGADRIEHARLEHVDAGVQAVVRRDVRAHCDVDNPPIFDVDAVVRLRPTVVEDRERRGRIGVVVCADDLGDDLRRDDLVAVDDDERPLDDVFGL